jgi:hypothetical protein
MTPTFLAFLHDEDLLPGRREGERPPPLPASGAVRGEQPSPSPSRLGGQIRTPSEACCSACLEEPRIADGEPMCVLRCVLI